MAVGAGTFIRYFPQSLGHPDDIWKCAYVHLRVGPPMVDMEKANRLQHYYQFQVLIKPSPDDIQQLYLDSLSEIGVNNCLHDIRFVEDDWESPALGAWG